MIQRLNLRLFSLSIPRHGRITPAAGLPGLWELDGQPTNRLARVRASRSRTRSSSRRRAVISTLSPVSRIRFGMSITDSASVQCTSRSPGVTDFNALHVLSDAQRRFAPTAGLAGESARQGRFDLPIEFTPPDSKRALPALPVHRPLPGRPARDGAEDRIRSRSASESRHCR
jgi:hypothetical protein